MHSNNYILFSLAIQLIFCQMHFCCLRRRKEKGSGMMREANALLSENRPDVADINKSDHVTYACRFHPNEADPPHLVPQEIPGAPHENCNVTGNIQMTILHNAAGGRSVGRGGQLYEKPSPPLGKDGGGGARVQRFSTFKQQGPLGHPDTHSLSSNCDYDRTITSITCPHNFVHYGDPNLLRQQHEPHPCNNNNNNDHHR